MNANFAFDPILPGQEFSVTVLFDKDATGDIELSVPENLIIDGNYRKNIEDGEIKWVLKGQEGDYLLEFLHDEKREGHELTISESKYKEPVKRIRKSNIKQITTDLNKKIVLNLFGWELGWLGTYIIFSIIFSMSIRKIIKVY